MDFTFNCPNCEQELEVDSSLSGSTVECPTCHVGITVPPPPAAPEASATPTAGAPAPPPPQPADSALPHDKHYVVPQHEGPSEVLIRKAQPTLEVAAQEPDKKIRIKTFRRIDTMTVNKDFFDEVVTEFLQKVGQQYIISINPINYTYRDLATGHYITDYGLMVVFRG